MNQSRIDSLMEAVVNVLIGFAINFAANLLILPWFFDIDPDPANFALLGAIYTVISIARSYFIRRAFNGQTVWEALKGTVRSRPDPLWDDAGHHQGLTEGEASEMLHFEFLIGADLPFSAEDLRRYNQLRLKRSL